MTADLAAAFRPAGVDVPKRIFDLVGGGAATLLLLPFMALIAVVIRVTSPGPAIFRQVRIGYARQPFVMLKFRTMRHDSDDTVHRTYVTRLFTDPGPPLGPSGLYKLTDDHRVTPIGRLLRRRSLDELPQLFNVLRGDMSLVGPRPPLPWEVSLYDPEHHERFETSPGITGLWQVNGRNLLEVRQALELDVAYVRRRSLALDLWILVRSVHVMLKGKGVR